MNKSVFIAMLIFSELLFNSCNVCLANPTNEILAKNPNIPAKISGNEPRSPKQAASEKEYTVSKSELNKLKNEITEIRRDQLNYKIEKELMKEIYQSNFKTINILITSVLGLFGFLGFFGLRDISSLQKKYQDELDSLNNIKVKFESEIKDISDTQKEARKSFESLTKTNMEQNKKIKILELRDKISTLFYEKMYRKALEYCAIAIEIDKNNIPIKQIKAMSHFKIKDYVSAIETFKEVIEMDKTDKLSMSNLCELYLFTGNIEEFDKLYPSVKNSLDERNSGIVGEYFKIVRLYLLNESEQMLDIVKKFLEKFSTEQRVEIGWNFAEFSQFLKDQPDGKEKNVLVRLTSFLAGNEDKQMLIQVLKEG